MNLTAEEMNDEFEKEQGTKGSKEGEREESGGNGKEEEATERNGEGLSKGKGMEGFRNSGKAR
jgi:hypothetical protein